MHIQEFNQIGELSSLAEDWSQLLHVTPQSTFFQSLEWLQSYWKHFGGKQKLRVLTFYRNGACVGIMPLVVRTEKTRMGRLRFLTYPLDHWGSFYGPIAQDQAEIHRATWAYIKETRRDWELVEPRWIGHDLQQALQVSQLMREAGLDGHVTLTGQSPAVEFAGTWDDFLATKTSKWRNNLKRWERKLSTQGQITHVRHRSTTGHAEAETRWDLFDACMQVADASWQSNSPDGTTLSHATVRPFVTDLHAAASRAGAIDLNLLLQDDRPIAFAYNYHLDGRLCGLRVGFDPEAGRNGAGNLLYAKIIEDSFRRGDQWYDLGEGSLDCKRHIATSYRKIYRRTCCSPWSIRARVIGLKRKNESRQLQIEDQAASAGGTHDLQTV